MPIYEYRCQECQERFEVLHLSSVEGEVECPSCHRQNARRVMSRFACTGVSTPSAGHSCSGSCSGGSCSSCSH